ncbi:MAG TPA: SH3 domain-containing protein [Candidatus Binatia bacterium]
MFGTPTANLRAGPGVEHELKLTLKEGDPVTIAKLEGEWFWVTVADGQQGYIHKNLLKLVESVAVQPQVAPPQKSAAVAAPAAATGTGKPQNVPAPATQAAKAPAPNSIVTEVAGTQTTDGKAPSLLQILDAHESEVKIGLLVAGIAFVIGWFCGGHYYIRREHKHRRRLRL